MQKRLMLHIAEFITMTKLATNNYLCTAPTNIIVVFKSILFSNQITVI